MSRKCELTGVGVLYGNKVSHSQRKTSKRFEPNMRVVKFKSDLTGQEYRFRVIARCIRCVDKIGGFDQYMLKVASDVLSFKAQSIRKQIIAKIREG